jgi:acyl-CoA thioesterase I
VCVLLALAAAALLTAALALAPKTASPGTAAGNGFAAPSPVQQPLRVLLIGDSLADGAYASTQDARFGSIVRMELARRGPVELTTAAVPGIMAGQMLSRVPSGAVFDVVIAELGTNDVGRTAAGTFAADYGTVLDALAAQSPQARLVCLGPWGRPDAVGGYDGAVAAQCRQHAGAFRPLGALFEENRWKDGKLPDGRVVDDFHPNDAGHALIAAQVMDALRSG